MELVEGEDLAQRLVRGPIPVDEALPIARQIAEALEAAHEQGIIHRDLKPANIKVRDDGTVKVLGFRAGEGTGRLMLGIDVRRRRVGQLADIDLAGDDRRRRDSRHRSLHVAGAGEGEARRQAQRHLGIWMRAVRDADGHTRLRGRGRLGHDGEGADARTFLGSLAWRHTASRSPVAATLFTKRKATAHAGCGQRAYRNRGRSDCAGRQCVGQGGRAVIWRWLFVAGLALLSGAVIAGLAVWNLKPSPLATPQAVARLPVTVPADEELLVTYPGIAVSPNGAHLVYVARRRGVQQLHLRAIDSLESEALVGTEGAVAPFFSPDGQWVGFFAEGKLKKIPVTGGASQIVCDAADSLGGSWAPNDVIYFAPGSFAGLWQVSANGGTPQPFTRLDPQKGEIGHRWPQVLPGGEAVLFTSRTGPGLMSGKSKCSVCRMVNGACWRRESTGYYVPTGHLVYVQTATGTLVAVPFDPDAPSGRSCRACRRCRGNPVGWGRRALYVVRQWDVGVCGWPLRLR